ncbi:MAG TPA: hypothetical protein VMT91_04870 [Anaerolineales bacterium]|nr:hypothetical protein [Anaerolineales bacterium]
MRRYFLIIACLVLVVSSCGRAIPTTTPADSHQPTLAPVSEPAGVIPASPVPPPTPTPPSNLPPSAPSSLGSLLVFEDDPAKPTRLTLFDPIQNSRAVISRPAGAVLRWDAEGLSPDGRYLAYYTGHLDALTDLSTTPASPQHVDLNIMRIKDGRIIFQKSLLNKDYPQNFIQAGQQIAENPPQDLAGQGYSSAGLAMGLQSAFASTLTSETWSPDGHTLAFASGSDGPSSDVFTYAVDTGNLTRITSGPSEVYQIIWSPDGKWILNSGIYWVGEGMCGTWYLSAADGSGSSGFTVTGRQAKNSVRGCDFYGWVSDEQALTFEDANGLGTYDLEVMDINRKSIDLIWPHTFHSFAFDPVAQQATISTEGQAQADGSYFQQGTYQVDLATHQAVSIAQDMVSLHYLGWEAGMTIIGIPAGPSDICFLPLGGCAGLANSGQKQSSRLALSSSRKNLVLYSDTGLWHIDSSGAANKVLTGKVDSVNWSSNPDQDLALVSSGSTAAEYSLYDPGTEQVLPLSGFSGEDFGGWLWSR